MSAVLEIFAFCTGVEYIVSHKIFEGLPKEEQKLWHSHAYEVFIILHIKTCISLNFNVNSD